MVFCTRKLNLRTTNRLLRAIRNLAEPSASEIYHMIKQLQTLDTSSLCDADKYLLLNNSSQKDGSNQHVGLRLLQGGIRPLNHQDMARTMVGVARTVQATEKDDFLCVLQGIEEAQEGEVVVVNTLSSSRAVAGELFACEAERKGLAGIVIDGPARDTAHLNKYKIRFYATEVSPYSGTTQSVGKMQQAVQCGGVEIKPGQIVVGDSDGIVSGSLQSFKNVLPIAQSIQSTEDQLRERITSGSSLSSMTNFEEHMKCRLQGAESSLEFRPR